MKFLFSSINLVKNSYTVSTYLTKSKFVHALDCPVKLYYHQNGEYKSRLEDEEFLQALAEGGLQVGELAKLYFPGGHDIPMRQEKSVSLQQTSDLLRQEEVTIYEAAIQHDHCFILVDVLEKKRNRINLIEVKSKSWEPDESFTYARLDFIHSDWQKYLFDVAFYEALLPSSKSKVSTHSNTFSIAKG